MKFSETINSFVKLSSFQVDNLIKFKDIHKLNLYCINKDIKWGE